MHYLYSLFTATVVFAQNTSNESLDVFGYLLFGGILVFWILVTTSAILWLWMFIDCLMRKFDEKMLWVVVLLGSSFVGLWWLTGVLYYFLVRKKLIKAEAQKEING